MTDPGWTDWEVWDEERWVTNLCGCLLSREMYEEDR